MGLGLGGAGESSFRFEKERLSFKKPHLPSLTILRLYKPQLNAAEDCTSLKKSRTGYYIIPNAEWLLRKERKTPQVSRERLGQSRGTGDGGRALSKIYI